VRLVANLYDVVSCSSRRLGRPREKVTRRVSRGVISQPPLTNDRLDDLAMHVGQTEISTRVAISQPLVVESQQMQQRGV